MKFNTKAIHVGQEPDEATGAVNVPIYQTSTFAFISAGKPHKDMYSRVSNPTRTALEKSLASLENGKFGFAFSSGLAAETTLLELFDAGTRILVHRDLYGGTYRLLSQVTIGRHHQIEYLDFGDLEALEQALSAAPAQLLWLETPTNPLMTIVDIEQVAQAAHRHNAKLVVDNTFLSPYFQNPLDLGADFVLHSVTKYINGHSDAIGGAIVTNDSADAQRLTLTQKSLGTNQQPFDSFLILRGIKTLGVRMEAHNRNALAVAHFLETHPKVEAVLHPGLDSHPQHALALRQMRGFGGTFSFRLKGGREEVYRFFNGLKIITLAESLGGVESLIEHPWTMTHATIPADEKLASGLTESLIRISVGLEDATDLISDLEHALDLV